MKFWYDLRGVDGRCYFKTVLIFFRWRVRYKDILGKYLISDQIYLDFSFYQ